MRIRMLRGALGSPDGTNVYGYEAGSNYLASAPHQETGDYAAAPLPLSERLAALFVAEGWAVELTDANANNAPAASDASTAAKTPAVDAGRPEAPAEPEAPAAATEAEKPAESEPTTDPKA